MTEYNNLARIRKVLRLLEQEGTANSLTDDLQEDYDNLKSKLTERMQEINDDFDF